MSAVERPTAPRTVSGGSLEVPEKTLPAVLFETAARWGDKPAFLPGPGEAPVTWGEAARRVQEAAKGLLALGLQRGDRVAIVAETCPEWPLADYAILAAGGVTVTVFPTLTQEQTAFLLQDSGTRFAFVGTAALATKLAGAREAAPALEALVGVGPEKPESLGSVRFLPLDGLLDLGRRHAATFPRALEERLAGLRPEDVATLVYTSGTTGGPKGAMLTHRNFVASVAASVKALGLEPHPVALAFLPLAHVYQRQNAFLLTALGGAAAFSTPPTLAQDLPRVQPTLVASVPRLYERIHDQIERRVAGMLPHRRALFRAAAAFARERGRGLAEGREFTARERALHRLYDLLVYRRVRRLIGATRLQMAITGSAAIRRDLLEFFHGIGVPILEGYGLTETAAPTNVNLPGRFRAGTVGPPLPGVEQRLAEDGEILVRGPVVFLGYHNRPQDTAEAFVTIDGQAWFRTGDLGEFDDQRYLRIVDRKKELEVLDTGKKIAPVPLEERLKESPYVAEALVVATGRKYAGCLIQPDYAALLQWLGARGIPYDRTGVESGVDATGTTTVLSVGAAVLRHPQVLALYQQEVDRLNATLAPFEQVRAFRLVPAAFSVESGELTPTLKKRRRVILERHAALVEELFPEPEARKVRTPSPEARS
ncbi:MAG TPA: long-chain fatty acid--CoA ligase [Candidatus Thermoplasmatota archaeon]|nr:long-chain fatty acid--CoA ligase [Candidatus Thermoplasmatota archaeon]